jgi:hypothetical protein
MMKHQLSNLAILICMAMPTISSACSVCMGDPEAPMTRGMIAGVGLLLGVTFTVLACFGAFLVYLARRSSLIHQSEGML